MKSIQFINETNETPKFFRKDYWISKSFHIFAGDKAYDNGKNRIYNNKECIAQSIAAYAADRC